MKPIDFKQSTKVLQRPSTMVESECQSLPVWCDGKQCVSCWKPTFKERLNVLFRGKVWLGVLSGKTQPPVFISGESIFQGTPIYAQIKAFFVSVGECITSGVKSIKQGFKQPDKRKHLIVGALISLVMGSLLGWWFGLIAGMFAGLLKEWWDSKGNGAVEAMDFVFTAIGSTFVIPFSWLFHFLIF